MNPRVDIICLVHNQLHITKGFVKSLFANTENFRLTFIDNGSTDETPKFLAKGLKDGKWDAVFPRENLGVIGGRNLGVKYIKSDYFMNIDNDQYVKAGWLDKLFGVINRGYDIAGCEAWSLTPPGTAGVMSIGGVQISDRSYFPQRHCENPGENFTYIGCGGMLIKREVYDKIGLFDDRFNPAYFEDPDFCWRAIKEGFKLGWSHDCPIDHLAHGTFNHQSLFGKNDQFIKSWTAFKDKWHPYFPEPMKMEMAK